MAEIGEFLSGAGLGSGVSQIATDAGNTVIHGLGIILIGILIASIVWVFLENKKYKHRLAVYDLGNGQIVNMVRIWPCKEYTSKSQITYWKPRFKKSLPAPPAGFVSHMPNGAKFASGFMFEGNFIPTRPDPSATTADGKTAEVEDKSKLSWIKLRLNPKFYFKDVKTYHTDKAGKTTETIKTVKTDDFFHHLDLFDGTQKWAYMQQLEEAWRRGKTWWDQVAPYVNMGLMFVVICVLAFAYSDWAEIDNERTHQLAGMQSQIIESQDRQLQSMERIARETNAAMTIASRYAPPDDNPLPEEPPR